MSRLLRKSARRIPQSLELAMAMVVSFPAPNPRVGKGLVTLERFLGCNCGKVSVTITRQYVRCYATGCKIVELHSDWLVPKQDSWPCTTLPCNKMQYHMKIVELQSDWLARKQKCWACKNQETLNCHQTLFPRRGWGLGTRLWQWHRIRWSVICHSCDNYWIPHPHSILPQVDRTAVWCSPMSGYQHNFLK